MAMKSKRTNSDDAKKAPEKPQWEADKRLADSLAMVQGNREALVKLKRY